jgi:hypothetical protein
MTQALEDRFLMDICTEKLVDCTYKPPKYNAKPRKINIVFSCKNISFIDTS